MISLLLLLLGCIEESEELYNMGYDDGCMLANEKACNDNFEWDNELTDNGMYSRGYSDGFEDCIILWEDINGC